MRRVVKDANLPRAWPGAGGEGTPEKVWPEEPSPFDGVPLPVGE